MGGLFARARSLWRSLRRPGRLEAEMDEEMRFHIEMESERIAREQDVAPTEALRRAAVAFGGVERRKEEGREVRGLAWLSGVSLDVKLAWRMLLKSPGLTLVGVLGISLGIAVGVGFFIVLSAVFNPRVPLEEGERIVAVENWDAEQSGWVRPSVRDFVGWRDGLRSMEQLSAASFGARGLATGAEPPQPVRAAEMTAAGFQVARVPPLLGRYLVPADEEDGAPPVAVLGYDLWQSRFEGDPGVIGRAVLVGEGEHTIVGVMPPGFAFPKNEELWTALPTGSSRFGSEAGREVFVFGRLAPGATREQAQAELSALGQRAAAAFPETNARISPQILPYTHPLDDIQGAKLWMVAQIQLMVNLLLVAIAVNMAVLVYARTAMRRGEIAVRTAIGASRRRIVLQLFVEALLLSLLAAGLGLGIAHVVLGRGVAFLESFDPDDLGFWLDIGLQPESVVYAVLLAVLAAVVVGVVPGLKSTGSGLQADLRRLGSSSSVRLGKGWTALIVAQVAIASAVLPTAMGIAFEVVRPMALRTTFPAHEFLSAGVAIAVPLEPGMDADAYRQATSARMADRLPELERRLESDASVAGVTFEGRLPGRGSLIEVEGLSSSTGSAGNAVGDNGVEVEAPPSSPAPAVHNIGAAGVATDYFELLDIPLLAGRPFGEADARGSAGGVIVTEAFVREIAPGGEVLGRRLRFVAQPGPARERFGVDLRAVPREEPPAPYGPWHEIVGVVPDTHRSTLDPDWAVELVYYAVAPEQLQYANLLVRVRGGDTDAFGPALRQAAASLDPAIRLGSVGNLGTMRNLPILRTIAAVVLFSVGTVLLFSAAGIHAMMSLTVTRRRKEIGIRTALGAHPRRVLANIFSRAAWQLGLGGLVGSLLGLGLLVLMGSTAEHTSLFLGGIVALMLMVGLIAAAGPARRGMRVQPIEALREE